MGRSMENENVLPSPTLLSRSILPPIIWTRRFEIARPSPEPCWRASVPLTCSNFSKILRASSSLMPMPWSTTSKQMRA